MSTHRQHRIWKRTTAVGVAVGTAGPPTITRTGLVRPCFAGRDASAGIGTAPAAAATRGR